MKRIWSIVRHHPVLASTFALALAATLFFVVRTALFTVYWADPAHRDQVIQGWMTPGYVAHSWQLPRGTLIKALDIKPLREGHRNLVEIADEQGIPLQDLIEIIEQTITQHRASQ